MEEQSHKQEMAAALRGDFERLRERRDPGAAVASPAPEPARPDEPPEATPPGRRLVDRLLRR
jgi:hypothetical protein